MGHTRIDLNSMNKKNDDIDKALKFWVSMDQKNLYWRNLGIKFYTRVLQLTIRMHRRNA